MLIGLCGRAGSGKTSVARRLVSKYGATLLSFAYPLKLMAQDIWGFSDEQVFGDATIKEQVDPRWGFSPRQALQRLGTEICRKHLGADVWVNALFAQILEHRRLERRERLWVIEDVRFINEARRIYENAGEIWRLHCVDSISVADATHQSEAEVDSSELGRFITAELRSSLALGLPHLFELVDARMAAIQTAIEGER